MSKKVILALIATLGLVGFIGYAKKKGWIKNPFKKEPQTVEELLEEVTNESAIAE